MKTTKSLFAAIVLCASTNVTADICPSAGCGADWLNVPGDFANPINNFSMYLLGGAFLMEAPTANGGWVGVMNTTPLNTTGKKIDFSASMFDHIGSGQGTSTLNATLNHIEIGSGEFFSLTGTFFIDGNAKGNLVDNSDSSQGHWSLNTRLYFDWAGQIWDFGAMQLSTYNSYQYKIAEYCDSLNCYPPSEGNLNGRAMNYHSGLAYLVSQVEITDINNPLYGTRFTIGLQGQDPVSATVPVPTAAWLLGSGLLGLVGVARRKMA